MIRNWACLAAAGLLLAVYCFGSSEGASETGPVSVSATTRVLARVNGVALTEREVRLEMERQSPYCWVHGGRAPAVLEPDVPKKSLDRMVHKELLFQDGQRRKIWVSSPQVDARIDGVRQRFASKDELNRVISKQFGSEKDFCSRTKSALMAEGLWNQRVLQLASASESEVREFYRQSRHKLPQPESVWLQTISFHFSTHAFSSEQDQARARAELVLPLAHTARSFEAIGSLAEKFQLTTGE